jgi:hypothetical protein
MSINNNMTAKLAVAKYQDDTYSDNDYESIDWLRSNMVMWYETANGDGITPRKARLHHRAAIMLHGFHGRQNYHDWNSLDGEGIAIGAKLAKYLLNCGIVSVEDFLKAKATLKEFTPKNIYQSIIDTKKQ